MHPYWPSAVWGAALTLVLPAMAALSPAQQQQLPPPVSRQVDFAREVQPILQISCTQCHGRGKDKGGYRIDTREDFLKGGDSGVAAKPGQSAESLVIEMVSGLDPDNIMPKKGKRLTAGQVGILRAWIDQGAVWPKEINFAPQPLANLRPRAPELPRSTAASGKHPVDRLLQPYYERHQVRKTALVDDRLFARRVYLDVIGILPPPDELKRFDWDSDPNKREKLVRRLLADNRRYAEHWLSFWNDLLRNDYKGTGYIDGGRKPITAWLYSALATNLPYDRMVAELVNPKSEAEGFLKGIVWRGAVNSSQTPAMQAAQNVSQVFMGVNLKCASCHDSFINDYTLAGTYALANVFSEEPLELFECDKPTGRKAGMAFLYPELGEISTTTNRAQRLQDVAKVMTGAQNGRLARTVVNRLWARCFGRGLVEPVDEMDAPAWHPDLLDWLAEDLVAHDYDLKRTLFVILTSRAYQRPAVSGTESPDQQFVFRGPQVRRLSAEQFRDALAEVTGVGYKNPSPTVDWLAGEPERVRAEYARRVTAVTLTEAQRDATNHWLAWFACDLVVTGKVDKAVAVVAANQEFIFMVNTNEIGGARKDKEPAVIDFGGKLRTGTNHLIVRIGKKPETKKKDEKDGDAAAASWPVLYPKSMAAFISLEQDRRKIELRTGDRWRFVTGNTNALPNWERVSDWQKLDSSAALPPAVWLSTNKFTAAMRSLDHWGRYRSVWVPADSLAAALDRPNREQVCTSRPTQATTLQALELSNGATLSALLQQGARELLLNYPRHPKQLSQAIYRQAFGRDPSRQEWAAIRPLLGEPLQAEGVEDLLWCLTMLPEFQLIY